MLNLVLWLMIGLLPTHTRCSIFINKQWNRIKIRFGPCSAYINTIPNAECLLEEIIYSGSTANIYLILYKKQVRLLKVQRNSNRSKFEIDFQNKCRTIAGVAKLYFCRELKHHMLMVLQFGSRGSLEHLIMNDSKFSDQDFILKVLSKLVESVDLMHKQGIVHHDLNPRNIVFDKDYHPLIIDLNSSRKVDQLDDIKGPIEFRAPEAFGVTHLSFRPSYDVYSLGITLYFMLFKHYPFVKRPFKKEIIFDEVYLLHPVRKFFVILLQKMLTFRTKRICLNQIKDMLELERVRINKDGPKNTFFIRNYKFAFGSEQLVKVSSYEATYFWSKFVIWNNLRFFFVFLSIMLVFLWRFVQYIFN
jgi:serine/threonine protein kinase